MLPFLSGFSGGLAGGFMPEQPKPKKRGLLAGLGDLLVPGEGFSDADREKLMRRGLLEAAITTLATPTGTGSALMGVGRGLLGGMQGVEAGAQDLQRSRLLDARRKRDEAEYLREQQVRDLAGQFKKDDGSFDMDGYRNAYMSLRPEEFVNQRANLSPRMQAIEAARAAGQLSPEQYQMAVEVELGLRPGAAAPSVSYVDGWDSVNNRPTKVPVTTRGIDWTDTTPRLNNGGSTPPRQAAPPPLVDSVDEIITELERSEGVILTAEQRDAIRRGIESSGEFTIPVPQAGTLAPPSLLTRPGAPGAPAPARAPGGAIVAGDTREGRIREAADKAAAETAARIQAEAQANRQVESGNIERQITDLKDLRDGIGTRFKTGPLNLLIPDVMQSADNQVFLTRVNESVLDAAEQLTGVISDKDMDFLRQATISMTNKEDANREILDRKIKILEDGLRAAGRAPARASMGGFSAEVIE